MHQVPGRVVCDLHDQPLLHIACLPRDAASPAEVLQTARTLHDDRTVDAMARNPWIARALEILDRVLLNGLMFSRQRCQDVLRARLTALGEDFSSPGCLFRFSAEMDAAFTLDWLQSALRLTRLRSGQVRLFANAAFSAGYNRLSHLCVAIVAAMLFPSADEACTAITLRHSECQPS